MSRAWGRRVRGVAVITVKLQVVCDPDTIATSAQSHTPSFLSVWARCRLGGAGVGVWETWRRLGHFFLWPTWRPPPHATTSCWRRPGLPHPPACLCLPPRCRHAPGPASRGLLPPRSRHKASTSRGKVSSTSNFQNFSMTFLDRCHFRQILEWFD